MSNLFCVHTPLQLLVAQQIIHQEQLKSNILLYGYVKGNPHFLDIYETMILDEMWDQKISYYNISYWAEFHEIKYFIKDAVSTYKNYRKIRNILRKYRVKNLFFGDIGNTTYQFSSIVFGRSGINNHFYEDGTNHYIYGRILNSNKSIKNRMIASVMDYSFFLPFFKMKWGYVIKCTPLKLEQICIYKRYSLVPYFHENYDVQLHYTPLISPKALSLIEKEKGKFSGYGTLLMTSPVNQIIGIGPKEYLEVLYEYINNYDGNILYVKFHPREEKIVRDSLVHYLKDRNIEYRILGDHINIPVEYYLQYIQINKVISFYTSTQFYNGYLYPFVIFESLLAPYYEKCLKEHKPNLDKLLFLLNDLAKLEHHNA